MFVKLYAVSRCVSSSNSFLDGVYYYEIDDKSLYLKNDLVLRQ